MSAAATPAWPAVVALGEVLVDFVALDNSAALEHAIAFQRAPGGAPAHLEPRQ